VCYSSSKAIEQGGLMTGKDLEFYENESVPDEEMQEFIDEEIAHVPQAPGELAERLQDNNAASPADSGGDIDANWEEVNDSGGESVFGHNPTPDQSDVEQNAHAMGLDYQDNEPLDLLEKIEKRDRNRYELEEDSKSSNDTI